MYVCVGLPRRSVCEDGSVANLFVEIIPFPFNLLIPDNRNKYWVTVLGFRVQGFRVQRSTQNAESKTGNACQDGYDHAGRTRATIRGFIKYLIAYEQGQQKKGNPER